MKYILTDHTADFGIRIFGEDPSRLFANAGYALFDMIRETDGLKSREEHHIRIIGEDWPDLMYHWLRELLYFWSGREFLVSDAEITAISEYELNAVIRGECYDPQRHIIKEEIKAVTYHMLTVCQKDSGWEAEVILDV